MVAKPSLRCVRERTQNLLRMVFLSEMAGKSQSRFFPSTPQGKKAITPRRSRASEPSLRNVGEVSESSIVAAKLSL
jgi:hypothetical protein